MTGCDTTSARGIGKASFLSLITKSKELQQISELMSSIWAEKEEIGMASISTFILLYDGNSKDTLISLR
jgi:hypothetical protein